MHTACLSAEDAELSSLYVMLAKARLWFSSSSQYTAISLCQDRAIDPHIMISHRSLPHVLMMDSAMSLAKPHIRHTNYSDVSQQQQQPSSLHLLPVAATFVCLDATGRQLQQVGNKSVQPCCAQPDVPLFCHPVFSACLTPCTDSCKCQPHLGLILSKPVCPSAVTQQSA